MMRRAAFLFLSLVLIVPGVSFAPIPTPAATAESLDSQAVLRALEEAFVSVADRVTPTSGSASGQ